MKKKGLILFTIFMFAIGLLFTACGNDQEAPSNGDQNDHGKNGQYSELPPTKEAIILIEGMEETINLQLYEDDTMYTYYPEDMKAQAFDSKTGDGVKFYANFNQVENKDVYVKIQKGIVDVANENDWTIVEEFSSYDNYPWAIEAAYFVTDADTTGSIYKGEYQAKEFTITIHFPYEYGDGFYPRANMIIDNIVWK
ncbi:hypothetical protein GGQ84_002624 [Desulfitispora alkaliphila]|uniref:hypothetical protein n=1 Tax=Desulfitispora alkaliphila TaxID=622674 RepID=UPI003D238AD7